MLITGTPLTKISLIIGLGLKLATTVPVDQETMIDTGLGFLESQPQELEHGKADRTQLQPPLAVPVRSASWHSKRVPPEGGYYSRSMDIICVSVAVVRQIWAGMAHRPVRDAQDWPALDLVHGGDRVNQMIREAQARAQQCVCSAVYDKNPDGHEALGLQAAPSSEHCATPRAARMYERIYDNLRKHVGNEDYRHMAGVRHRAPRPGILWDNFEERELVYRYQALKSHTGFKAHENLQATPPWIG
ncbi:hypothetical protein TWF730_003979 [Orbilia blumenaviensis]|uniref:Uncharacterized protein n=1 Tax=Orbilia blumenaviensis TaxID=1796055 RepID=A0AAV9U1X4_9PEZI